MWRHIRDHEKIILEYRPAPKVAVLYDQDSSLLDFAMAGSDARAAESHRGYYQVTWESDVYAEYVRPVDLDTLTLDLLIVPWHLTGKNDTLRALRDFLHRGGTLLLEARFGLFDDRLFQNPHVLPAGLNDLLGYEEEEPYYQPRDGIMNNTPARTVVQAEREIRPLHDNPSITVRAPIAGNFGTHTYLVPLIVSDADPIAWCQGHTVGVRKQVGKGSVYYFGTNLGATIAEGEPDALKMVRTIILDIASPDVTGHCLRPRLNPSGDLALLIVFNEHEVAQEEGLVFSDGLWTTARDLDSGESVQIADNSLKVRVPTEDVRVFKLNRH